VFGPLLLRGLVDLVLAVTRSLPVALGALACYGVGTSTGMVTYNALLQAEVPPEARGRVFAGFDLIWQTGRLASLALGGGRGRCPWGPGGLRAGRWAAVGRRHCRPGRARPAPRRRRDLAGRPLTASRPAEAARPPVDA
jgi:hypothetical protein